MKHIRTSSMTLLSAAVLLLAGCMAEPVPEDGSRPEAPEADSTMATIRFNVSSADYTRSSVNPPESGINDLNIIAYRGGRLAAYAHAGPGSGISLELARGHAHNLYALANTGRITPPLKEEDLKAYAWKASGIQELQDGIPMSWSLSSFTPARLSGEQTLDIRLVRLVSRIGFTVDTGTLKGFTVKSVRMLQCPNTVRPFAEGGSRALATTEVTDGDRATASDLDAVNAGRTIRFYCLENCQGRLLPGNRDMWQKVPENIAGRSGLCSYIEVKGTFEPGCFYAGDVTYRFYPGWDNCTDFNMTRNTDIGIRLIMTQEGLREISWKVDANLSIQDGYATGTVSGRHAANDLYIGEYFDLLVDMKPELMDYLGGNADGTSLEFVPAGAGGSIAFGNLEASGAEGSYRARCNATAPGTGSVWLLDRDGSRLMELCSGVAIQKPLAVASLQERVSEMQHSSSFECRESQLSVINGKEKRINVYFTDRAGYNLNTSSDGYNLGLFSFSTVMRDDRFSLGGTMRTEVTGGTAGSDGPAATCTFRCTNDGLDRALNDALCHGIATEAPMKLDVHETGFTIPCPIPMDLYYQPVTVVLVDNGWANYPGADLSLRVRNPSNITLFLDYWMIMKTNPVLSLNPSQTDIDNARKTLDVQEVQYLTGSFNGTPSFDWTVQYPRDFRLYGSKAERIESCRGTGGTERTFDRSNIIHPLKGIRSDDVLNAMILSQSLNGMNHDQTTLHNLINVSAPFMQVYENMITVKDSLSDGSYRFEITYGDDPVNDGLNDRGLWVWADGLLKEKATGELDSYELSPSMLDRIAGENIVLYPTFNSNDGYLYGSCYSQPVKADIRVTVNCRGYVKTKPKGTNKSEQDNWCDAHASSVLYGVEIGNGKIPIDDRCIQRAMDEAYSHTYPHKNGIWGANDPRHAKPVEVQLNIQARLSGTGNRTPTNLNFDFSTIKTVGFHDTQDGKFIRVKVTPWSGNRKVFVVSRKK